jgi:hypothetical protein
MSRRERREKIKIVNGGRKTWLRSKGMYFVFLV